MAPVFWPTLYVDSVHLDIQLTKELCYYTGKYALNNLVSYLPAECHVTADEGSPQPSNATLSAVISTLADLVADNTRATKYDDVFTFFSVTLC